MELHNQYTNELMNLLCYEKIVNFILTLTIILDLYYNSVTIKEIFESINLNRTILGKD